jgi:hypothetical protein
MTRRDNDCPKESFGKAPAQTERVGILAKSQWPCRRMNEKHVILIAIETHKYFIIIKNTKSSKTNH